MRRDDKIMNSILNTAEGAGYNLRYVYNMLPILGNFFLIELGIFNQLIIY